MNKPQKIYAEVLEDSALEQFNNAMAQGFVVQGALMPDAHTGYTLPIGAVVACKDVVVPAYVGYDIGCGMIAFRTRYVREEIEANADSIREVIYSRIPVGFKKHESPIGETMDSSRLTPAGQAMFEKRGGMVNLGTLGGGNHFIEIGHDEADNVWIVIHSGSRGAGHGIAGMYMELAANGESNKEGHYPLHSDSKDGRNYINDMNWMLEFALLNRRLLVGQVMECISRTGCLAGDRTNTIEFINRNHNHAELNIDGLWIHRKGATHAEKDMMGVIPGNMRDGSFIVRGKGNPESLFSSSHGAGRVMSRKQARKEIDVDDFVKSMDGISARVGKDKIDEAPAAYKDIFEVMKLQEDLVEVVHHIKPIINIKG